MANRSPNDRAVSTAATAVAAAQRGGVAAGGATHAVPIGGTYTPADVLNQNVSRDAIFPTNFAAFAAFGGGVGGNTNGIGGKDAKRIVPLPPLSQSKRRSKEGSVAIFVPPSFWFFFCVCMHCICMNGTCMNI
jgi:hypothetical protein